MKEEEVAIQIEVCKTFELQKAVCSHGFFMMSPNRWDPLSLTLSRPLHLSSSSSSSVWVSIAQKAHTILVRVQGIPRLSSQDKQCVVSQVVRMLRLSEREEMNARLFQEMANGKEWMSDFGGRVYRSPTLFEDMVKCILLCNCQWSRTLSMATALCQLQLELQSQCRTHAFIPNTPTPNESYKKLKKSNEACNFEQEYQLGSHEPNSQIQQNGRLEGIGNFPTPAELAKLDGSYLTKRCNLGYRASRIVKLAQSIVEGRISLEELELLSEGACLSNYDMLADQLRQIDGFGAFTCANVLVCMGYYHVIPTDSETVRHLKQIHSRHSTKQTIQKDVEDIFTIYAPFQFLAYWAELWYFYNQRFGKLSEMKWADYKLITATNMRDKQKRKRIKREKEATPRK